MLEDADWEKFLDDAQNDQTNAGLAHIAETLAGFRDLLLKQGFTTQQTFLLVRDFFYALINRFFPEGEEDEEE